MEEEIIGKTGHLVDFLNEKLTQKEWNALCIVHRMTNRLNTGIRFDYDKSIDVRSPECSQIIDESVFLEKEKVIGNELYKISAIACLKIWKMRFEEKPSIAEINEILLNMQREMLNLGSL